MSRKFLTSLDMGKNQFVTPVMENLSAAPSSPVKGQLYMNTTDNTLYWWDGSAWRSALGGGTGFPGFGVITAETTFGTSKNDGVGTTTARNDHAHGNPTHDAAAHSAISRSALAAPTADLPMAGFKLTGLGTPTAGTDAATKDYTDNLSAGLSWKEAVRVATTASGTLASAFANGQTVDGVVLATGNRILLKNQSAGAENGIYTVNASGAPTRATDADAVGELEGAAVFVMEGTTQADTAWTCTTNAPITPGSTATTWAQFGAGTAYTAGNGLTLTGSTIDVVPLNGSIVVAADSVSVGFAGTGSAVTAAKSDHNHDATYTKVFAQDCAANVLTTVTHNFNTRDVTVEVYRTTTPWDSVECDIERPSVNAVDVRFATAPTAGQYRIVVTGIDQ
jgi:hypothetical protein